MGYMNNIIGLPEYGPLCPDNEIIVILLYMSAEGMPILHQRVNSDIMKQTLGCCLRSEISYTIKQSLPLIGTLDG